MSPAAAHSFARHRFLVAFSTLAVVLLGFFALGRLPIDLLPSREAPRLRVSVSVPGVPAPALVEKVTQPLEAALTGVTGVTAVESVTTSGGAFIDLYLKHRHDAEMVQRDVTARLALAKSSLPASVELPAVSLLDDSSIVAEFAITSPRHDLLALRDWTEGEFAKRLQELSGVSAVDVTGGAVREVLVMPDQRRLAGLGLAFGDVLQALRKTPEADTGTRKPPVKIRGRRVALPSGNVGAVAALPVALPSGESIPLSEIARITLSEEMLPDRFRFDGTEAVKVTVQKQPWAAASEVTGRIQAHIDWMRANRLVPEGLEIHLISKRLDQARQALQQVALGLPAGFALVLFGAYLLLGSGRRTLILGLVIVASLQAVFVALALSGRALDVMNLFGLAFGTGLFGGAAVLLFAHAEPAAHDHGTAVNPAIVAAVTLVMALMPVLFAGGGIGAMFREFVLVLGAASLISALLASMLVAAFDARSRRREHERWNAAVFRMIGRMRRFYSDLLRRLSRYPAVILIVFLVLAGAIMAAPFLERQGFPPPAGGHAEKMVLRVQGPSYERLAAIGDELARRLRDLPDWREVKHSGQASREELVLQMDEVRARELGVDVVDAGKALAIALSGIPAGSFRDAERHYDIRLRLPPEESGSAAALGRILLLGELEKRPAVHLHDVATVERVIEPVQIRRYDGIPTIEVTFMPAVSAPVMARVRAALESYTLPAGYRMSYGLPGSAPEESRRQGVQTVGWALFFVFAALVLLLRSPRMALAATLAAFTSLAGVVAAMLLFDIPLSSPVWLGALILIGITAGDAAVAVTFLMAQSGPGVSAPEMIAQMGKRLFHPFLVMTLMTMLGMAPLVFAGDSALMLRPFVMTVAVGLLFSLAASLLLAPLLCLFAVRAEQIVTPPRL